VPKASTSIMGLKVHLLVYYAPIFFADGVVMDIILLEWVWTHSASMKHQLVIQLFVDGLI